MAICLVSHGSSKSEIGLKIPSNLSYFTLFVSTPLTELDNLILRTKLSGFVRISSHFAIGR